MGELDEGVSKIVPNMYAFAAIKNDGSVVTWGRADSGGDSTTVAEYLVANENSRVESVVATCCAFAARRSDGTIVTWGNNAQGGDGRTQICAVCSFDTENYPCSFVCLISV